MKKMSSDTMRTVSGGWYKMTCPKCCRATYTNVASYLWHYLWCRG